MSDKIRFLIKINDYTNTFYIAVPDDVSDEEALELSSQYNMTGLMKYPRNDRESFILNLEQIHKVFGSHV